MDSQSTALETCRGSSTSFERIGYSRPAVSRAYLARCMPTMCMATAAIHSYSSRLRRPRGITHCPRTYAPSMPHSSLLSQRPERPLLFAGTCPEIVILLATAAAAPPRLVFWNRTTTGIVHTSGIAARVPYLPACRTCLDLTSTSLSVRPPVSSRSPVSALTSDEEGAN